MKQNSRVAAMSSHNHCHSNFRYKSENLKNKKTQQIVKSLAYSCSGHRPTEEARGTSLVRSGFLGDVHLKVRVAVDNMMCVNPSSRNVSFLV